MMYATCAKVGCMERIRYDETSAMYRPRYCKEHTEEMKARLDPDGDWNMFDILNIRVRRTRKSMETRFNP